MREIRTSGSMSGERNRNDGMFELPQVTAPLLDSTETTERQVARRASSAVLRTLPLALRGSGSLRQLKLSGTL